MTEQEKQYAKWCAENDIHKFYNWRRWKNTRQRVLRMDKHECQMCKARKKFTRATTVHHVNHFRSHPELALEIYYTDMITRERKRNLISLCHDCHEEAHGYRKKMEAAAPLTTERWD